MKKCSFFILLALTLMITGCINTNTPAPIEYHHKNSNSSNSIILGNNYNETILKSKQKPLLNIQGNNLQNNNDYVIPEANPVKTTKIIYHEVNIGETIEDIALQYKQNIEDIAAINDLYYPYYLDEFQIIKIKVPKKFDSINTPTKKKQILTKEIKKPDFISPVKGNIISKFGSNTAYGKNKGINIAAKAGTKIISATDGKVIYADYDATYGYLVIVKMTGKNIIISYAHLEDIILSKNSLIKQGDIIGYLGSTGKVAKPQLHFAIREGKKVKNPLNYIQY